ncbi:hypothetical protein [Streptomyces sp. RKAG337]|uniref:hypothetical protein n=1 Tax=Streptomyces sp. RKAG337 TaxID=2893404 RepID=UPI002033D295|nr:hypothetical protein [Streptomyces sp. RKAG337]MCM2426995.1 hypothetical protein [Streptomyces sp. RKAG337]
MPTLYGERWNEWLDEPIEPLTEDEARARHERGELYTVAYIPEGRTKALGAVEVRLQVGHAAVYQFDEHARITQIRSFSKRGDRMFLEEVTDYEYPDGTERLRVDQASVMTEHTYNEDGTGRRTVYQLGAGEADGWDLSLKPGQTMENHWTAIPAFGDYDGLGRAGFDQKPDAREAL